MNHHQGIFVSFFQVVENVMESDSQMVIFFNQGCESIAERVCNLQKFCDYFVVVLDFGLCLFGWIVFTKQAS